MAVSNVTMWFKGSGTVYLPFRSGQDVLTGLVSGLQNFAELV